MSSDISNILASLTKRINQGVLSGSVFLGNPNSIENNICNYHPVLKKRNLPERIAKEVGKEIIIDGHSIRSYKLEDKSHNGYKNGFNFYLVRVDSTNIYSAWDKTDDIDIKDTLELALLAYKRKQEILIHATKAAMAAIMTRNMSHNIGSHVISYWNQVLDKLDEKFSHFKKDYNIKNELKNLITDAVKPFLDGTKDIDDLWVSNNAIDCIETSIKIYDWASGASKINPQTKAFLHYLQQRMDFIAEIITSSPSWERTMDMELDIINPFINLLPMMYFIAYSENLSAYDYKELTHPYFGIKDFKKLIIKYDKKCRRVSIPHGTIGVHAFYSILENFIRNSAKHGTRNNTPKDLEITISIKEDKACKHKDDKFLVTLSDNLGNCSQSFLNEKIRPFLSGKDAQLVDAKKGDIKSGGWGIKEMRISANFLMLKDSENIMNSPDIIRTLCSEQECSGKCELEKNLGYQFNLYKPKDLLIVKNGSMRILIDKNENESFNIKPINRQEFIDGLPNGYRYKFIVIEFVDQDLLGEIRKNKEKISPRLLYLNTDIKDESDRLYINKCFTKTSKTINNHLSIMDCYKNYISKQKNITTANLPKVLIRHTNDDLQGWTQANKEIWKCEKDYNKVNETFDAIFDQHGENIEKFYDNDKCCLNEYPSYYHILSSGSSFSSVIHYLPPNETMREFASWELLEMIATGILFVDERISGLIEKNKMIKGMTISVNELYKKMGIFILKDVKKGIGTVELKKLIESQKVPTNKCHFLVIHQGIMDKSNEPFEKWQDFLSKIEIPHIVVDSGRGKPSELIANARFVQVSALLKMLEDFDKFSLVQTLASLRRKDNMNNGG